MQIQRRKKKKNLYSLSGLSTRAKSAYDFKDHQAAIPNKRSRKYVFPLVLYLHMHLQRTYQITGEAWARGSRVWAKWENHRCLWGREARNPKLISSQNVGGRRWKIRRESSAPDLRPDSVFYLKFGIWTLFQRQSYDYNINILINIPRLNAIAPGAWRNLPCSSRNRCGWNSSGLSHWDSSVLAL